MAGPVNEEDIFEYRKRQSCAGSYSTRIPRQAGGQGPDGPISSECQQGDDDKPAHGDPPDNPPEPVNQRFSALQRRRPVGNPTACAVVQGRIQKELSVRQRDTLDDGDRFGNFHSEETAVDVEEAPPQGAECMQPGRLDVVETRDVYDRRIRNRADCGRRCGACCRHQAHQSRVGETALDVQITLLQTSRRTMRIRDPSLAAYSANENVAPVFLADCRVTAPNLRSTRRGAQERRPRRHGGSRRAPLRPALGRTGGSSAGVNNSTGGRFVPTRALCPGAGGWVMMEREQPSRATTMPRTIAEFDGQMPPGKRMKFYALMLHCIQGWNEAGMNNNDMAVGITLALVTLGTDEKRISVSRLANHAKVSRKTVYRSIARLRELGFVKDYNEGNTHWVQATIKARKFTLNILDQAPDELKALLS